MPGSDSRPQVWPASRGLCPSHVCKNGPAARWSRVPRRDLLSATCSPAETDCKQPSEGPALGPESIALQRVLGALAMPCPGNHLGKVCACRRRLGGRVPHGLRRKRLRGEQNHVSVRSGRRLVDFLPLGRRLRQHHCWERGPCPAGGPAAGAAVRGSAAHAQAWALGDSFALCSWVLLNVSHYTTSFHQLQVHKRPVFKHCSV